MHTVVILLGSKQPLCVNQQSPSDKVLRWAVFIKQILIFELVKISLYILRRPQKYDENFQFI